MNRLKMIDWVGNGLFVLNVIAGIVPLHWAVIFAFAVCHAFLRLAYLKVEQDVQGKAEELKKIQAAMPLVRYIATLISSVIMAGILYGIGYGVQYLVQMVLH
ncbi:hypothetical protein QDY71_05245 [Kingella negevensis]|uniref:Uncharacterized protein n=1 Tax=Kingella negevensis TaxID=1522312 RepID=A0A238TAL4_9NEIS|nr:hypothetical protein [Kingella negevensis]MDK4679326.1 hypothetical protein [Kingella negevensis]MDK4682953.1 hypothetical protein [Kingella negevensis]MDK4685149.1 hypothetical protein [Kingella negevensis]MDK4691153.1 hypothetical protein [Kingella negevensis]MDK4693699.1 hypothetical protein [Kingella negevensis]